MSVETNWVNLFWYSSSISSSNSILFQRDFQLMEQLVSAATAKRDLWFSNNQQRTSKDGDVTNEGEHAAAAVVVLLSQLF